MFFFILYGGTNSYRSKIWGYRSTRGLSFWKAHTIKGGCHCGVPVLQPKISLNQKPLHIWTHVYCISHLSILNHSFIGSVLQPRISLNQKSLCIRALVYYISPSQFSTTHLLLPTVSFSHLNFPLKSFLIGEIFLLHSVRTGGKKKLIYHRTWPSPLGSNSSMTEST